MKKIYLSQLNFIAMRIKLILYNKCYSEKEDTSTPGKSTLFNTLPRSLRQQNLVTSQREIEDPKVIKERKELIANYSPSELAQFKGISDFPVPSKITNMFEKKEAPKRA